MSLLRTVWALLLLCWATITLICVNVCQILLLPLVAVPRIYRWIHRELVNGWISMLVWMVQDLQDVSIRYYGDDPRPGENAIVFANHISANDILALLPFVAKAGHLGDMNFFTKDVLKWIPGLGWGLWLKGYLTVKRNWMRDQMSVERTFSKILRRKSRIWLMIFPEGTRQTPEKLKKSRLHGFHHGFPDLTNVMLPRTAGFVASVLGLGDHLDAVYDVTIAYPAGASTLWRLLRGEVKLISLHIKRFEFSHIASLNDEGLRNWLIMRFVQKDKLLRYFSEHQEFPS